MPNPTITITLMLPPKELNPNDRAVPYKFRHARGQYRADARLITAAAMSNAGVAGQWKAAIVQAKFYFKQNRKRDADNLLASLKSAFDGIVDGGLLVDDNELTHLPVRQEKDATDPRVELLFTEVIYGEEEKD